MDIYYHIEIQENENFKTYDVPITDFERKIIEYLERNKKAKPQVLKKGDHPLLHADGKRYFLRDELDVIIIPPNRKGVIVMQIVGPENRVMKPIEHLSNGHITLKVTITPGHYSISL